MRSRHKKWAEPYLNEHNEIVLKDIDLNDQFFKGKLQLEIGSGKGDFAIQLAKNNPSINLLALERDISIAGMLAKKVVDEDIHNIRIIPSDFDLEFEKLNKLTFDRIYLNFSDPWPKKRHEKRRLTTLSRLENMMKLLTNNGQIRIKTDNDILYAYTLTQIELGKFFIVDNQENYSILESDDYMSEYERNFRSQGKNIHRIIIQKGE